MLLTLFNQDNSARQRIYEFLLSLQLQDCDPVLVLKDGSFSFYHYLRLGKMHRIPFDITGNLLSVSAVNMYHLEEIIKNIKEKVLPQYPNLLPVFMDFSKHYIDDSVSPETARFLFKRDLGLIEKFSARTDRPALFIERGNSVSSSSQVLFRSILHHTSGISMNLDTGKTALLKQNLTLEEKQKLYGSPDSGLFYLCGQFVQGMERIPQIAQERRPGVLRRIFQDNIPEYPGGQCHGQPVPNGNGAADRGHSPAQIELQPERRTQAAS